MVSGICLTSTTGKGGLSVAEAGVVVVVGVVVGVGVGIGVGASAAGTHGAHGVKRKQHEGNCPIVGEFADLV